MFIPIINVIVDFITFKTVLIDLISYQPRLITVSEKILFFLKLTHSSLEHRASTLILQPFLSPTTLMLFSSALSHFLLYLSMLFELTLVYFSLLKFTLRHYMVFYEHWFSVQKHWSDHFFAFCTGTYYIRVCDLSIIIFHQGIPSLVGG